MVAIPATAVLTAVLGLLQLALALRVSRLRFGLKIPFGDGGNPAMMRAIRVHANGAEHAPLFLLLALAYELTAGTDAFLIATGAAFVVSRLVFSIGIIGRGLHAWRMFGAGVTYFAQLVLGVGVLGAVAVA